MTYLQVTQLIDVLPSTIVNINMSDHYPIIHLNVLYKKDVRV